MNKYSIIATLLLSITIQCQSECDWVLYQIYPIIAGQCSYDMFSDSAVSVLPECDGKHSATITTYSSNNCSGVGITENATNGFSCGNFDSSGECNGLLMDVQRYSGDSCSGSEKKDGRYYIAQLEDECIYYVHAT